MVRLTGYLNKLLECNLARAGPAHWFIGYLKAVWPPGRVFGGVPGPGREGFQKCGRASPSPTFCKVFLGHRGRPAFEQRIQKIRPDCSQAPKTTCVLVQDYREPASKFKQWEVDSLAVRDSLEIPHDLMPFKPKQLLGVNTSCARVMDLLNVAYASRQKQQKGVSNFFCDVSQGVLRRPWAEGLRTMTTSWEVFDFEREQIITSLETLALQGLPVQDICTQGLAPEDIKKMAGQAMCLPCIGSIMMAYFLCSYAPWWKKPRTLTQP